MPSLFGQLQCALFLSSFMRPLYEADIQCDCIINLNTFIYLHLSTIITTILCSPYLLQILTFKMRQQDSEMNEIYKGMVTVYVYSLSR